MSNQILKGPAITSHNDVIRTQKAYAAILSTAIPLCVVLLAVRADILGLGWLSVLSPFHGLPRMLIGSYYDFVVVALFTVPFFVLVRLTQKMRILQMALCLIYILAALVLVMISLANIQFVKLLGRPFNYQWLYYSDFLRGPDVAASILSVLTLKKVVISAAIIAGIIIISFMLKKLLSIILVKYIPGNRLLILIMLPFLLYVLLANWYLNKDKFHWNYNKMQNPAVSFMASVIAADTPELFTMNTLLEPEGVRNATQKPKLISNMSGRFNSGTRNILIYVMDAVAAEYLESYGGRYSVTPELQKYHQQSIFFKNIYAHAPATNKSLLSILCSIYPWLSYQSLTLEYPDSDLVSLSRELKKRDYRTAFFSSGDIRFQGADRLLKNHDFDLIQDYRNRRCARSSFVSGEDDPFLDGSDDLCTADSLTKWIEEEAKPFFAIMWTYQTHYPYFVSGKETDYGVKMKSDWEDVTFNRYLNAINEDDRALGKILQALKDKGLAESTLVIVMSDHGEAFGLHGQYGHASGVYEENVHVPLIMINPELFNGQSNPVIGGLIDIVPTIMDLLDLPLPENWQGNSLFSLERSPRVYFFAPWSQYLFGYREGDRKFIYNASMNTYEIYDLIKDPHETVSLLTQSPDSVFTIQQRLAAWVQYQDKLFKKIISTGRYALDKKRAEP